MYVQEILLPVCTCYIPLQYTSQHDVVISGDQSGMVEYWSGPVQEYGFPKAAKFQHKIDTDLYEFAKVNSSTVADGHFSKVKFTVFTYHHI